MTLLKIILATRWSNREILAKNGEKNLDIFLAYGTHGFTKKFQPIRSSRLESYILHKYNYVCWIMYWKNKVSYILHTVPLFEIEINKSCTPVQPICLIQINCLHNTQHKSWLSIIASVIAFLYRGVSFLKSKQNIKLSKMLNFIICRKVPSLTERNMLLQL